MKAILTQTIGPSHKAGDVVQGQNSKIKKLIEKGVATPDHSMIGMVGSIVTWIICGVIIASALFSFFHKDIEIAFGITYKHYVHSSLWRWTLFLFPFLAIVLSLTQFFNSKNPYVAYFLAMSLTFVGGLLIFIGHERAANRYQDKRMSGLAALLLMPMAIISFLIMVITCLAWNATGGGHSDEISTTHFTLWVLFMMLILVGVLFGLFFDNDFINRRRRFIEFLKRKNTSIEYKDRALKALRVFKSTQNQENFNARIIDIFEHTMEQDMKDVLEITGKKK